MLLLLGSARQGVHSFSCGTVPNFGSFVVGNGSAGVETAGGIAGGGVVGTGGNGGTTFFLCDLLGSTVGAMVAEGGGVLLDEGARPARTDEGAKPA